MTPSGTSGRERSACDRADGASHFIAHGIESQKELSKLEDEANLPIEEVIRRMQAEAAERGDDDDEDDEESAEESEGEEEEESEEEESGEEEEEESEEEVRGRKYIYTRSGFACVPLRCVPLRCVPLRCVPLRVLACPCVL